MKKIGKYEVKGEIGRGAMGVVYLGYDPVIERQVAIKTMNAEAFEEEEQKERFLREARSAGALQHPNIVTIYEMGMEGDTPFIAMEYVEGADLSQFIREGKLETLEQKINIVVQVCDALEFAHRKSIIHRDIKPANIRILPDGTVKIMDFGIAKKQDSDFTRTGLVVGTLSYMSPEQVQGKPLDPRSDQFSTGVVFYQMLTGKKPFAGDNITNVVYQIISFKPESLELPGVSPLLSKIVQKMMAPDPQQRFTSCAEVAGTLRQELKSLRGETTAPTEIKEAVPQQREAVLPPPIPISEPQRKTHGLFIFVIVLFFVIAAGATGYWGYQKFGKKYLAGDVQREFENPQNDETSSTKEEASSQVTANTSDIPETKDTSEAGMQVPPTPEKLQDVTASETSKAEGDLRKSTGKSTQEQETRPSSTRGQENKSDIINQPAGKNTKRQIEMKQVKPPVEAHTEEIFKKEGPTRQTLARRNILGPHLKNLEAFKEEVGRKPWGERRYQSGQELNRGRVSLGNQAPLQAVVHFWRSVILNPQNSDAYAWLVATLIDMKAYEEADMVLKKAREHGVSLSDLNRNRRFQMAYPKLQSR